MNPGDRVRQTITGCLGFVLYAGNIGTDEVMARFDGNAFNTLVSRSVLEVLPSEPFRPAKPATPTVTIKYHIAYYPYAVASDAYRTTELHRVPARWVPPVGTFVDEITVR